MRLEDEIIKIAESALSDPHHFIVDVAVSARKGPKKVLIFVDGDNGVSIDDCALISRAISNEMDDRTLMGEESYMLEVSTPGIDQPLKLKRQYRKNVGRKLRVKLAERTEEGKLESVSEDSVILLIESGTGKKKETKSLEIPYGEIEKAFVLISFK